MSRPRTPGPSKSRTSRGERLGLSLLVALILLASQSVAAAAQGAPKIAVVDLDRIFAGSDQAQRLQEQLKQLEDDTQKAIDEVAARLTQLQQDIASKTGDERRLILRQKEDEEIKARRLADTAKRDANRLEQKVRGEFNEKLQGIFAQLQEENSYDLILNKNPAVVIYAGAAVDISDAVLEKLGSGS